MNLRSLAIPLTLVAAFCVSFAVLWWQRNPQAPKDPPPSPVALAQPAIKSESPAPAPGVVAHGKIDPPPPKLGNLAPYLPAVVVFRSVGDDGKSAGSVINSSNETLPVVVHVISAKTGTTAEAQLNVPPNGQASFGGGNPDLWSGDQVVVTNPGYKDLSAVVP
jgi:hypothetical protein